MEPIEIVFVLVISISCGPQLNLATQQNYVNSTQEEMRNGTSVSGPWNNTNHLADAGHGAAPQLQPIAPHVILGNNATLGQFVWQVLVVSRFWCGGCLISNKWVLTAGHCVQGSTSHKITYGTVTPLATNSSKGTVILATKMFLHPGFDSYSLLNDIALLLCNQTITLSNFTKPIRLPRLAQQNITFENATVIISGWGDTKDGQTFYTPRLLYGSMTVISNAKCMETFSSSYVKSTNLCAFPNTSNTCYGDSGGPGVLQEGSNFTLIGVVSYGASSCVALLPSAFSRVTSYLQWIASVTGIPPLP